MISRRWVATFATLAIAVAGGCSSNSKSTDTSAAPPTSSGSTTAATDAAPDTTSAPAATTGATDTESPESTDTESTDTESTDTGSTTAATPAATCEAPTTTTPVDAAPVGDDGQDWSITSFDGTVIRAHWFPLPDLADDVTAPTILMGPGWGSPGDTDVDSVGLLGVVNIATLRDAGYNVLTWDPRGFGESTGTVEIDSAEFEGRDVEQLIDWVATQPQVELDGERDPRMGMFGASYGGGIQLVTAGIDCRIDAIVPVIAWHSLQTSLFKANTPKTGWANLLSAATAGHQVDETITRANASSNDTGKVDPADAQWFTDRGPGEAIDKITVPTLIVQGTVDTLFTLDEGVTNYTQLHDNGVPTAMLWFCGGHGGCFTDPGDVSRTTDSALAWLDRYVVGNDSADVVPAFGFVDQDGTDYTADRFPMPSATPLSGLGAGTLDLTADGGAGPATVPAGAAGLAGLVAPITPGRATNAVDVTIDAAAADTVLVGAPKLSLTYSGTVAAGDRPTRVFAQLVDDTTGLVLGNQITPIEVVLDGQSHITDVPMEMIAFTSHPTGTITLQIVATTTAYAQPQLGGSIDFSNISIELPAVTGAVRVTG